MLRYNTKKNTKTEENVYSTSVARTKQISCSFICSRSGWFLARAWTVLRPSIFFSLWLEKNVIELCYHDFRTTVSLLLVLLKIFSTSLNRVSYQSSELSCLKQRDSLSEVLTKGCGLSFARWRFVRHRGPLLLVGTAADGGVGTDDCRCTPWNCSNFLTILSILGVAVWSMRPSTIFLSV